jgi:NAD(P)-dependent dehydrogenase (short-subunit alcohol dehydrogenase family)
VEINGSVCLVTGANRGLGRAYVGALLEHGARKVYAAARSPESSDVPGVVPVRLDITRPDEVARAAVECPDVTLLMNNAGLVYGNQPLDAGADLEARKEMETNYFGTMAMCRAFIPVLEANGGGALVNVLSVASWVAPPVNGTYSASKAAEWLLTNAVRRALRPRGILVVGVHASFIDTDMSASIPASAKISAESVALQTLEAIEAGHEEVLADERTRHVKSSLPNDLSLLYPQDSGKSS